MADSISLPTQLLLFDGKVCKQCGEWKPLKSFCVQRKCIGGREPRCRQCSINPERKKRNDKKYSAKHKEKIAARVSQYQKNNREAATAKQRAWRQQNQEKVREYRRKWKREKPERFKEVSGAASKKYRERHPAKMRALYNNSRARRRNALGEFTEQEWVELCERYGNVCLRCGSKEKVTVDHVIPISKGGSNDIGNIQPLCYSCNSRKHDSTVDYRMDEV